MPSGIGDPLPRPRCIVAIPFHCAARVPLFVELYWTCAVAAAHAGAVATIQRTGGAMRLHARVLALDGLYVRDGRVAVQAPFRICSRRCSIVIM